MRAENPSAASALPLRPSRLRLRYLAGLPGSISALPPALLLAAGLAGCFQSKPTEVSGGGGVETTGGAIASLTERWAGARVRMIPADYNPLETEVFPESLETFTGEDGKYAFRGLAPGVYNLEVWQPGDGTRLFRAGIVVRAGAATGIPADTLRAPCRVRLFLEGLGGGTVYQPGMARRFGFHPGAPDSGTLILDSLPSGILPPFYLADFSGAAPPRRLTDSLRLDPGSATRPGAYSQWSHEGIWHLDTGPAGADLSGEVRDYPLLLRLTRADFDFAEALPGGEDVRFSDAEGNRLPFALERWDSALGKAEIWVGLERLRGGAAGPEAGAGGEIRMHWGKAGVRSLGRNAEVFDTAFGFAGVWHLDEAGNNGKDGYTDATPIGTGGRGTLMAADPPDSGLVAGAQAFDGDGGNIRMDSAPFEWTGAMTVSAWVQPGFAPDDTARHAFLSRWEQKDSAGFWLEYAPDIRGVRLGLGLAGGRAASVDAPDLEFAPGEWHHLAATYDGARAIVYWDGEAVAQAFPGPAALADNPRDFLIGAKGAVDPNLAELDFFRGRMDEVRYERVAREPDRLKLDYRTQRPGSAALRFERVR